MRPPSDAETCRVRRLSHVWSTKRQVIELLQVGERLKLRSRVQPQHAQDARLVLGSMTQDGLAVSFTEPSDTLGELCCK